jgi:hypothetical protein
MLSPAATRSGPPTRRPLRRTAVALVADARRGTRSPAATTQTLVGPAAGAAPWGVGPDALPWRLGIRNLVRRQSHRKQLANCRFVRRSISPPQLNTSCQLCHQTNALRRSPGNSAEKNRHERDLGTEVLDARAVPTASACK